MFKNIAFLLFFVSQFIYSQETIKGIVTDENNQPLLGANVFSSIPQLEPPQMKMGISL